MKEDKIKKICYLLNQHSNEIIIENINKINIEKKTIYVSAKRILSVVHHIDFIVLNQKIDGVKYLYIEDRQDKEYFYYKMKQLEEYPDIYLINLIQRKQDYLSFSVYCDLNANIILKEAAKKVKDRKDWYYILCRTDHDLENLDPRQIQKMFYEKTIEKKEFREYLIKVKNLNQNVFEQYSEFDKIRYLQLFIKNIELIGKLRTYSFKLEEAIRKYHRK